MTQINLEDLPDELLLTILDDTNNWLNIAHVSRRFHQIAEPYLYRDVVLKKDVSADNNRPLRQFTRSVILRPALAWHVRSLSISWTSDWGHIEASATEYTIQEDTWWLDSSELEPKATLAREQEWSFLARTASSIGMSPAMQSAIRCGSPPLIIIVLLHHLPNLISLNLPNTVDSIQPISDACMNTMEGGIPQGLRSLNSLTVCNPFLHVCDVAILSSFINLPHLQKLVLSGLYISTTTSNPDDAVLGKSSMETLELGNNYVHPALFKKILQLPRALKKIIYVTQVGPLIHETQYIVPSLMGQGLWAQRLSLTHLEVKLESYQRNMGDVMEASTLGSLRSFEMLSHVYLPITLLLGLAESFRNMEQPPRFISLLPPSLTALELDCDEDWTSALFIPAASLDYQWNIMQPQCLPHLTHFKFYTYRCSNDDRAIYAKARIQIERPRAGKHVVIHLRDRC